LRHFIQNATTDHRLILLARQFSSVHFVSEYSLVTLAAELGMVAFAVTQLMLPSHTAKLFNLQHVPIARRMVCFKTNRTADWWYHYIGGWEMVL